MAAHTIQPSTITKAHTRTESATIILRRAGVDRAALEPLPAASLSPAYIDGVVRPDECRNLCLRAMLIRGEYHVAS